MISFGQSHGLRGQILQVLQLDELVMAPDVGVISRQGH